MRGRRGNVCCVNLRCCALLHLEGLLWVTRRGGKIRMDKIRFEIAQSLANGILRSATLIIAGDGWAAWLQCMAMLRYASYRSL